MLDPTHPAPGDTQSLQGLLKENEALRIAAAKVAAGGPGSRTTLYITGVIVLCLAAAATMIAIEAIRPDKDNTAVMLMALGIYGPSIAGLLGAAVREVHLAFNSRMTELLLLTAKASRAEGQLIGAERAR